MDPKVFTIIDGKLYLNWNEEASKEFNAGVDDNIEKADANWEILNRQ